jgi:hypothetical protein
MKRQVQIMLQHKAKNPTAYEKMYQAMVRIYSQAKVDKAISANNG